MDRPATDDQRTMTAVALPAPSACPPPLVWTEVLSEVRRLAQQFGPSHTGAAPALVFGHGSPLYFLNGWSGNAEVFCLTAWLLRDDFRCVLIDYPEEATQLSELASAVLRTATELGDERFSIFASGFGAAVALTAARDAPLRVQRLTLQGPIIHLRLTLVERLLAGVCSHLPRKFSRIPLRQRLIWMQHRLWFPPIDPTRWRFLVLNLIATPLRQVAQRFRMLDRLDLESQASSIDCQTLIISSEGDPERVRNTAQTLASVLPHAQTEELPNCGQLPFVTHPHRLANLLRAFLKPPAEDKRP